MANVQKYNKVAVGHLFKHYERSVDEKGNHIKYGNQDIDTNLSHRNYNLAPERNMDQMEFIKKRTSEVSCLNRKDVNVMCSWVITLPQSLSIHQEREFFEKSYDFLQKRYGGEENVISGYVHLDEIRPHMHFSFVPVVEDRKKGHLKVSAKEAVDRSDLQTFHQDLSKVMEAHFGKDIGILNEATKQGNRSIDELKRNSATEILSEAEKKAREIIEKSLQEASKIVSKAKNEVNVLEDRIESLKVEYDVFKEVYDKPLSNYDTNVPEVEFTKKGFMKKEEFALVPKDIWESRNLSFYEIESIRRKAMEIQLAFKEFEKSKPSIKNEKYARTISDYKEKNFDLNQRLESAEYRLKNIDAALRKNPDIEKELSKAINQQKAIAKSMGIQR